LLRVGPGVPSVSEIAIGTQVEGQFVPINSTVDRVIETFLGTDIVRVRPLYLTESEGSVDTLLGQEGDDFISATDSDFSRVA
jgi:hypothetical protein